MFWEWRIDGGEVRLVALITAIQIKKEKKGAVFVVEHAELLTRGGIAGDFNASCAKRGVSLMPESALLEMNRAAEAGGICALRFWPNIVADYVPEGIVEGELLRVGGALCRIEKIGKGCHEVCELYKGGITCNFAGKVIFLSVVRGGGIFTGSAVTKQLEDI